MKTIATVLSTGEHSTSRELSELWVSKLTGNMDNIGEVIVASTLVQ